MRLLFVYLKTQMSSWLGETDEGDGEGERVRLWNSRPKG